MAKLLGKTRQNSSNNSRIQCKLIDDPAARHLQGAGLFFVRKPLQDINSNRFTANGMDSSTFRRRFHGPYNSYDATKWVILSGRLLASLELSPRSRKKKVGVS